MNTQIIKMRKNNQSYESNSCEIRIGNECLSCNAFILFQIHCFKICSHFRNSFENRLLGHIQESRVIHGK